MHTEKIPDRITQTCQTREVAVYDKRAERITVVLGEGINSMKCDLAPTRNGLAYASSIAGHEIVYERSRAQVQNDLDRDNPNLRKPGRR